MNGQDQAADTAAEAALLRIQIEYLIGLSLIYSSLTEKQKL
jgi:hypothetical protein